MVWTKSEIPPLAFLIEFTRFELSEGCNIRTKKVGYTKNIQIEDIVTIAKLVLLNYLQLMDR